MANNKPLLLSNTSSESNLSDKMDKNQVAIIVSEDKVRLLYKTCWFLFRFVCFCLDMPIFVKSCLTLPKLVQIRLNLFQPV